MHRASVRTPAFTQAMDTWLSGTIQAIQATARLPGRPDAHLRHLRRGPGRHARRELHRSGQHRSLLPRRHHRDRRRRTGDGGSHLLHALLDASLRGSGARHHHDSATRTGANDMRPEWASRAPVNAIASRWTVIGAFAVFMTKPGRFVTAKNAVGWSIPRTRYKRLPMHGGKAATSDIFGGDRPPYRPRTYHNLGMPADVQQRIHCHRRFANCDRVRPARERRRVQATLRRWMTFWMPTRGQ